MKIKILNLSLSCAKHTHVSPAQMLPQASYLHENDSPRCGKCDQTNLSGKGINLHDVFFSSCSWVGGYVDR